ncbi:hypothetical protein acsn021_43460 [Anaerocolumna cellulosilytica]|uniref:Uncharacterized protein n=1 Tax=Anaerocolumna cellulosilytica TaxID=433286 RepID=A0A6S6R9G2_9FIRM|nr:hypothetical protein [Anaerocolumna cellulosilytica]MBB5195304.1 hypothetical protein [Anaerocolumna cellulosilytica]BCJ96777.1 hypothetical protein acsn021_43460 [Anaerocolumna cellulosilytica]
MSHSNNYSSTAKDLTPEKHSVNKRMKLTVAGILIFIIVTILIKVTFLLTPAYEKPIQSYTAAIQNSDFKRLVNAYPDYIQNELKSIAAQFSTEEDYMNLLTETLEDSYGEKIKLTYHIKDKVKLSKDKRREIEAAITSYYNKEIEIKSGYTLIIDLMIKGVDNSHTEELTFNVIKIDSNWYLADMLNW